MYAVCYYWRSVTFMPTIDFTGIILPQFFQGFAVACFFLPLTTISFSGLPDNKFANASSMSNFSYLVRISWYVVDNDAVGTTRIVTP